MDMKQAPEVTTPEFAQWAAEAYDLAERLRQAEERLNGLKERVKETKQEISKLMLSLRQLATRGHDDQMHLDLSSPAQESQNTREPDVPSSITFTPEHHKKMSEQLKRIEDSKAETEEQEDPEPVTDTEEQKPAAGKTASGNGRKKAFWDKRVACSVCGKEYSLTEAIALTGADFHWDKDGNLAGLECSDTCVAKAASRKRSRAFMKKKRL